MYYEFTRQALPDEEYLKLVGAAICTFNSNNSFVIENIIRASKGKKTNWYQLIDQESGRLSRLLKNDFGESELEREIVYLFDLVVRKRNRIVHSFQITYQGEQILATKDKNNEQFLIDKPYLKTFISDNERLSSLLHKFRGY